jgi:hypothetical protein
MASPNLTEMTPTRTIYTSRRDAIIRRYDEHENGSLGGSAGSTRLFWNPTPDGQFLVNKPGRSPGIVGISWTILLSSQHRLDCYTAIGHPCAIS